MWEERFLTRDLRFPDYQSGVVWVRCEEVRVQLIIIENRFCGERRRERVMGDVMRESLSEVVISLPIFAHLLLPDDVLVPADGAEPQQVGLLLGHPVAELPEADQQGAPVLSSVL